MPHGNPALGQLRPDDGRVLGARDVAAGGAVQRVLLSSCMLGRTDGASANRSASSPPASPLRALRLGWLAEVPDEAACLFSLALQFALKRELSRGAATAAWSRAFHDTRAGIAAGRWPKGFAAWCDGVPASPVPQRCPVAPSPALQRALLWV